MPASDCVRPRTSSGVPIRAATVAVMVVLALAATACTGGDDHDAGSRDRAGGQAPGGATTGQSSVGLPDASTSDASSGGLASLLRGQPLVAAVAVVPERAAVVTFTDLDRVKQRLGYADLTSDDLATDRFAFWENVRSDSATFGGTRLYDASSEMADDYGWTAEDVSWEVDYALTENGCGRSMICDTARGYVLGLRPDLDWSLVTESLQHNGFRPDGKDPRTFRSDDPKAPFAILHLIPELHAVAGGNAIGVQRLAEVVAGAPAFSVRIAPAVESLGVVESVRTDTGCVDLPEALGPDAGDDDVVAYVRAHPIGRLDEPVSTAVAINDARHATVDVTFASNPTSEDLALRTDAIRSWAGGDSGTPFARVADVRGKREGLHETFTLDVTAMPVLRAMTLTDEAPWALCPYAGDR